MFSIYKGSINIPVKIELNRRDFPSKDEILEMAELSHLVYRFRDQSDCESLSSLSSGASLETSILPKDIQCHLYRHDIRQGTKVLVVSNVRKQYIAVVFTGTDDLRTFLADGDIVMKPFGPNKSDILLPGRVHAGFDNNVFTEDRLDMTILEQISQHFQPGYRIFTTGHSLGAADAVLVATELVLRQNRTVTCINFGCPRIGNYELIQAMNNLQNLSIWRFVLGWDLIPRLPSYPFQHVGHTVQMSHNETKVYYHHLGNTTLQYAGVPSGWGSTPFVWVPGAMESHRMIKYLEHLQDPTTFLNLSRFVTLSDIPMADDDDFPVNPPDDNIWKDVMENQKE
jgi:Lipase (class 3)